MTADTALRGVAPGVDCRERRRGLLAAAALTTLTAAVAFVSELASLSAGKLSLYGFVLVGGALAAVSAYWNSGLAVSWFLALAPVLGPLAVYRGFMYVRESVPVALPLSFYGPAPACSGFPLPSCSERSRSASASPPGGRSGRFGRCSCHLSTPVGPEAPPRRLQSPG